MQTFSCWLENEIKKRGWKPADLAHKANISRGSLSTILSDMRRPGPDVCLAIARALNVSPEEVFRQAGLLPPKPQMNGEAEELLHLFQQLNEIERKRLLQTARAWAETK